MFDRIRTIVLLTAALAIPACGGGTTTTGGAGAAAPSTTMQNPQMTTTPVTAANTPGAPRCGDDIVQAPEVCERNVAMQATCATMRPGSTGFLNCTSDCKFDFSMCVATQAPGAGTGSATGGTGAGAAGTGTR